MEEQAESYEIGEVELTMDDYIRAWEASVRIVKTIPEEKQRAIEARFQLARERAQAVLDGRIEPLSAWVPSERPT